MNAKYASIFNKRKADSSFICEKDFHKNKKVHTNENISMNFTDYEESFVFDSLDYLTIENRLFWENEEEDYTLVEALEILHKRKQTNPSKIKLLFSNNNYETHLFDIMCHLNFLRNIMIDKF